MKKIGITGSLASGKTTASKILSLKKGPLFSADAVVKNLYKNDNFTRHVAKKFNIKGTKNLKKKLKDKIIKGKSSIKKLEKIVHPLVRNEMKKFINHNKKKRFLFFEIPLLVESKLMKNFDLTIFVKAKKNIRLKRFISKGGNKKLFEILNKKQLNDSKKIKVCDFVVVNEKNITFLKKNLLDIMKNYE